MFYGSNIIVRHDMYLENESIDMVRVGSVVLKVIQSFTIEHLRRDNYCSIIHIHTRYRINNNDDNDDNNDDDNDDGGGDNDDDFSNNYDETTPIRFHKKTGTVAVRPRSLIYSVQTLVR